MRHFGVLKQIMAFGSVFSPTKQVGTFIREGALLEDSIHLVTPLHRKYCNC